VLRSRLLGSADSGQSCFGGRQDVGLGKEEQCKAKIIIIKRHTHGKRGNSNQLLNSVTTTLRKAHGGFDYNIVSRDTLKIIIDDGFGARSGRCSIINNINNYNTIVYNIYNLNFKFYIHTVS